MTKEEVLQTIRAVAKEMLDETRSYFDAEVDGEVYSDMNRLNAILEFNKRLCAAVKSLPDVPDTNDGDTISRQAAIDKFTVASNQDGAYGYLDTKSAVGILNDLPSVQPEYEPVTAKDFANTMSAYTVYRYTEWHGEALALMKEQGVCNMQKEDVIYREAAIEAMSEALKRIFPEHREIAENCLNALPSAQPEQKWIPCSERMPDTGYYLV